MAEQAAGQDSRGSHRHRSSLPSHLLLQGCLVCLLQQCRHLDGVEQEVGNELALDMCRCTWEAFSGLACNCTCTGTARVLYLLS